MYDNVTVIALLAIITLLYYITTKKFNYWKNKNVPHPKPIPIFGNYLNYILLRKSFSEVSQEICRKFRKEPYFGTYFGTEPALVILDPEMIKHVFTKDFYFFSSRELMDYRYRETVTQNIFFQCGDIWKVIRTNMSALFSSAKLKNMFYLIDNCAHSFENLLERETKKSEVIAVRDMMIRYTMDSVCSCAFGVESRTMEDDAENNPFTIMGRVIFGNSYFRGFCTVTRQIWPHLFYGIGLRSFPVEIDNFFNNLLTGVFKSRDYTPTQRHDFVDLLLSLKKTETIVSDGLSHNGQSKKVELEVDDALMVSVSTAMFGAGFETSAGAMSLTLYELSKNQEALKRAHEEVDNYLKKNENKLKDNCVYELPYLEACINETLRLYPVIPVLTREVVSDYTFPSGLSVERDMRIHLPVYHLHRDPELFPDPEAYKPERFLPDAKHEIKPYTFFPFGEGPRTCIGMRFSKLQMMPGLITFLKTFSVEMAKETPHKLALETTTLLLQPASNLPVKVTRRPGWENRVYAK